jgi:hypothetical protein
MSDYTKIGSTVLTTYVAKKKNFGGDCKAKTSLFPTTDGANFYREGRNPAGIDLDLLSMNSEANLDAALKAINEAITDTVFYPHTTSRFARVALASAWPDDIVQKINAFWRGKAKIYYTVPCLFAYTPTTWAPALSDLSAAITPAGSIAAPLDLLSVTGTYSGTHLTGLAEEVYQNDGTTLRDSVAIATRLLSDEVLTLDYRGKILQTYADDFAASTRWGRDAVTSGATHGSGHITVGNECDFYYWLKGPWPLSKNLVVSATIAISAGIPLLEYSFDAINWQLAYSGTQLTATNSWVIPNTSGHGDVYIRFRAISEDFATLTTALAGTQDDLKFTARLTGVTGNDISMEYVKPGSTTLLSIAVTTHAIVVTLATTGSTCTTTGALLREALFADVAVMALLSNIEYAAGNDGTGLLRALAHTHLAGATGDASFTVDNLSISQERLIPESELPILPLGSASKVKIVGTAGGATIAATYRDRYWI